MSASAVPGEFWTENFPDDRQPGLFSAPDGEDIEVSLDGALRAAPTKGPRPVKLTKGDVASHILAGASGAVSRFRPVSFYGDLQTGEMVSVFEANNHGSPGAGARYKAHIGVIGAQVTPDQLYTAVRFRLDHPYWLQHLADSESGTVADDQSILRVEAAADGNWLTYESVVPATLRQLEIRVVSGCLALVELAMRPRGELVVRDMQVRVDPQGPWLVVKGAAVTAEPANPRLDTLLPPGELTVSRFARWIELNDRFDGLAWAVARPIQGSVQAQVQVMTSLVEGLHRRLPETFEQECFPDASGGALDRVGKAAATEAQKQASAETALDPAAVYKLVRSTLGHINQVSYRDRAEDIVQKVAAAVPEIADIVPGLAGHMVKTRDSFAHQLPQDAKDPLEDRVRRWIVIAKVTPWLLRALLLLETGIEPSIVRQKFLESQSFAFDRVNAELRVRQLGWEESAR